MKYLLLIFLLAVNLPPAGACDCMPRQAEPEGYNNMGAIFIGRLIRQEFPKTISGRVSVYKVQTWYKGRGESDTVVVSDSWDPGACGLGTLQDGEYYIVFAVLQNDTFYTSRCLPGTRVPNTTDRTNALFSADTAFLNYYVPLTKKNGKQKFYNKKGTLLAEGNYRNGTATGIWKYYTATGRVYMAGKYLSGKKDSTWFSSRLLYGDLFETELEYYKNGINTLQNVTYNGKRKVSELYPLKNGKWISKSYHNNGRPRFVAVLDPPYKDRHGRLKQGLWNGPFRQYDEKGNLEEEGEMYNGFETGIWKYYKNGTLLNTTVKKTKAEADSLKDDQ